MSCLSQQTLRRLLTLATLTLLSATLALAQETSQPGDHDFAKQSTDNWGDTVTVSTSGKKLFVLTMANPTHRHTCRLQSFAADKLVCKGSFHKARVYKPQDIAALTISDDKHFKVRDLPELVVFNALAGASTWGTIVLVPTCPLCAAATAFAAVVYLVLSNSTFPVDGPESLLYLAPGQTLQVKLRI